MQTATLQRKSKQSRIAKAVRDLIEFTQNEGTPKLRIDRTARIIYGVKVAGHYSPNNHPDEHGNPISTNGTEYSRACFESVLPQIEGAIVRANHPPLIGRNGQRDVKAERDINETFGQLRNAKIDEAGDIRADLHYVGNSDLTEKVLNDVESGLGLFGLSWNARSGHERLDRNSGRLVVESISLVRSVDLVNNPATNRNLWESTIVSNPKKIRIRDLIEQQSAKRFSPNRLSWVRNLLEDDKMKMPLCEEMDSPGDATDPEDALWGGFHEGIVAILGKYKGGELDDTAATKQIGKFIKAHAKLTQEEEPKNVSEEETPDNPTDKEPDSSAEEKKRGKEIKKEEGEGSEKKEKEKYESLIAVMDLCESLGFAPSKEQRETLLEINSVKGRKTVAESFRAAADGVAGHGRKSPKSYLPAGGNGRQITESKTGDEIPKQDDAVSQLALLRRNG